MQRHRVTYLQKREALKQRHIRCSMSLKPKVIDKPVTIESRVKQKIQKVQNWKAANPGLEWTNPQHETSEPKIYIPKEMLESKVYRSLTRVAMLLLQDFMSKRIMKRGSHKKWFVENNGQIVFPYLEAEQKGFSRGQFRDGIDELQSKGFIDITHRGQGGRKPLKGMADSSRYWLDDRWKFYGTPDFKPARMPRQKDTRQGRGWSLMWNASKRKNENKKS